MPDFHISLEAEEPLANFEIGVPGPPGPAGPNSVTSATTSDGTAELEVDTLSTTNFLDIGSGNIFFGDLLAYNYETELSSASHRAALGLDDMALLPNDGTATIDVLDATVQGTLTADHIHGNLAGSVYAHIRAGENLAKGDPVYISGSHGSGANLIAIVSKADASNAAKMPAVGVMDAAVTSQSNGHMVITGTITELNTNAFAVNTVLYVATGGGWTSTPPAANSQAVAIVERSNNNNGAVIVKVNGLGSSGGNGASDANKLVRYNSTGGASLTGGTLTDMTYAGTAAFTSTTRPTSAGTGTPTATSLITLADAASSTVVTVRDEFIGGGITTTNIGELAWYQFSSGGGTGAQIDVPAASLPQIGIRGIRSSNAINSANTIYLSPIGNLLSVTGWEMTFVIQLNQTTACDIIVGVTKDNGAIGIGRFGGTSFGCRYSSAHDTNFMFYAKNSNTDFVANDANNFAVSSGVPVNTNFNTFRIRSTSIGAIEMSINGGAFVAVTTSMISTASPFIIFVYISTRETASKTATIDFFSLRSATTRL